MGCRIGNMKQERTISALEKVVFNRPTVPKNIIRALSKVTDKPHSVSAMTEEKALRLLYNLIKQPINDENLDNIHSLLDEITDKDKLLSFFNYHPLRKYIIDNVSQEYIVNKINSDCTSLESISELIQYLDPEHLKKIKCYTQLLKQITNEDENTSQPLSILRLTSYCNLSDITTRQLFEYLIGVRDEMELDENQESKLVNNLLEQKKYGACSPFLGYLRHLSGDAASKEIDKISPHFEEIFGDKIYSCSLFLKHVSDKSPDTFNELLPKFDKMFKDSYLGDSDEHKDKLLSLYKVANEENQKLGIFYDNFFKDNIYTLADRQPIAPLMLKEAKNPDYLIKKLMDLRKEGPTETHPYWNINWKLFSETPLWDIIWNDFTFDGNEEFKEWYEELKPEQKKAICDADGDTGSGQTWYMDLYDMEPSFRDRAVEIAIEQHNRGNNYGVCFFSGTNRAKQIYEAVGLEDFIDIIHEDGYLSDIKDTLVRMNVDINKIDYKKLLENDNVPKLFFIYMGKCSLIYDTNKKEIISFLKNYPSKSMEVFSDLGVGKSISLLGEYTPNKDVLIEFKDIILKSEDELTTKEFEDILNLYEPIDASFCLKLIEDIPKDDLIHFTNSKNTMLKTKALTTVDPRKFLKSFIDNKNLPPWLAGKTLYISLFGDIDVKYLREFVIQAWEMDKLDPISKYIVTNLYPDNYLDSSYYWAFEGAPKDKIDHYIEVVGIENFEDNELKTLLGTVPRFEKKEKANKLPHDVIEDKLELLHLLLPLAKSPKVTSSTQETVITALYNVLGMAEEKALKLICRLLHQASSEEDTGTIEDIGDSLIDLEEDIHDKNNIVDIITISKDVGVSYKAFEKALVKKLDNDFIIDKLNTGELPIHCMFYTDIKNISELSLTCSMIQKMDGIIGSTKFYDQILLQKDLSHVSDEVLILILSRMASGKTGGMNDTGRRVTAEQLNNLIDQGRIISTCVKYFYLLSIDLDDRAKLFAKVVPYFDDICVKVGDTILDALSRYEENDTLNKLLPKYDAKRKEPLYQEELYNIFVSADEKNQLLDIFVNTFKVYGIFCTDSFQRAVLPVLYNAAKNKDKFIKNINSKVESKEIPLTGEPIPGDEEREDGGGKQ